MLVTVLMTLYKVIQPFEIFIPIFHFGFCIILFAYTSACNIMQNKYTDVPVLHNIYCTFNIVKVDGLQIYYAEIIL